MKYFLILLTFLGFVSFSQEKIETTVEKSAQPVGGQTDVDYVFQSQVVYPENLLKKESESGCCHLFYCFSRRLR